MAKKTTTTPGKPNKYGGTTTGGKSPVKQAKKIAKTPKKV